VARYTCYAGDIAQRWNAGIMMVTLSGGIMVIAGCKSHRQSVKNATISIASARHGVIPVENARPRAGGSGRSVLGASASRAARSRRRRRWATPRKEIVS
jgi:hypothetical protein